MKIRLNLLLAAASAVARSAAQTAADKVTFLRDVAPILNKVGCTSGTMPRRGQGQERIQALAARLRSRSSITRRCSTISPAAASIAPTRAAA